MTPRAMKWYLQGLFYAPECNFGQWRAHFRFSFTEGQKKSNHFLKLQSQFLGPSPIALRQDRTQGLSSPSLPPSPPSLLPPLPPSPSQRRSRR